MHNLAIAMLLKNYEVTGSDDQIFDPSRARLEKYGLLPREMGWFPDKIHEGLDAIILGMHARENNPELLKAQKMGLKIFSYPEYIYEQTKDKVRVVIGGSHGKTSITSMILHVLQGNNLNIDYMVGAQLEGFECMVSLSEDAEIVILEGDEYLSSPIDRRPKFHLYKPNIALLSGIAWDHINVFPTFENYVEQFQIFVDQIEEDGSLIWYDGDENIQSIVNQKRDDIRSYPYNTYPHEIRDGVTHLLTSQGEVALKIFGNHNLQNLFGALHVCRQLGLSDEQFYSSIQSFTGASKRLELIAENINCKVFKDFAHSPSKLKATTSALKSQYPKRKLIACMELHTFSSLNATFLQEYKGTMSSADEAIVYFSPDAVAHKKLDPISVNQVERAFDSDNVKVYCDSQELRKDLRSKNWKDSNLLLMSSGNFGGINLEEFATELCASD